MTMTSVTAKGQIVIPAKIRHRLNIKKGIKLCIEQRGDKLILKAITPGYIEKSAGALGTKGKLARALLCERAKDKERER